MQALGLLPKQAWRRVSHLPDSHLFKTARALSSSTFAITLHGRFLRNLPPNLLKQCPHSRPKPVISWHRGGQPMPLPLRFASNSRKTVPPSRNEARKLDGSPEVLLRSSKAPFAPEVKPLPVAIDSIRQSSKNTPSDLKRYADEDLVYVVHLRRNKLAIWSVVAIFVAVYVLGVPLRDVSDSQEISESRRQPLLELAGDGEALTRMMQPLVPALAVEKLAYQVKNWPPSPDVASWSPFITSMFPHGSLMHLGFNCYGFYQLSSYLMCTPIGISGTLTVWFLGGLAATQLSCYSQKSYANGTPTGAKWSSNLLKKDPIDPNPVRTLNAYNLGASGGLMSMIAVVAVWRGSSLWGLPLINIPIPARFIGLFTLAWDLYGNYNNSPDGIGHNAHLCGLAVGAGIALLGLSRGRYAKTWRLVVER